MKRNDHGLCWGHGLALYVGRSGYDVFNLPRDEYNFGVNVRWPQEGIDAGRSFLLASPLTPVIDANTLSIFGQGYWYLTNAGYRVSGNFLVPGR
jgi:hypothetical protein